MKIRLLKSWDNGLKKFARGCVLEVHDQKAKKLIDEKTAEQYMGVYPPKDKMKHKF